MSRWLKLACALLLALASLPAATASAQIVLPPCAFMGLQPTGAIYYISQPINPNTGACITDADLVVFAHGYVPNDGLPVEFPEEILFLPNPDDPANPVFIPGLVNTMGYAFAATSYSQEGLAVVPGVNDIVNLVDVYKANKEDFGTPAHTYVVGGSEGSLVATLALEKHPEYFSGGLAMCGPIGDFRAQVNYWGDFRVVFDYFFKGVLPPSPIAIPDEVMLNWDTTYVPAITAALARSPLKASQLISVTNAAIDLTDKTSIGETAIGVLWYNAFATNDGFAKLGGQPFGNTKRNYSGSLNDTRLNQKAQRFAADGAALDEIALNFQTSGKLSKPLVTLHTLGDPIVPYRQASLYTAKVFKNNARPARVYAHIPILRYGHCNFTQTEILAGFFWLVGRTRGQPLNIDAFQFDTDTQAKFYKLAQGVGK